MAKNTGRPTTVTDFIVTIGELADWIFVKLEGGKVNHEMVEYSDGLTKTVRKATGRRSFEDITISKPFYSKIDVPMLEKLQELAYSEQGLTVVQKYAKKQGAETIAGETIVTYTNCLIVSYTIPNHDDIGSDAAMVEIVLAPNDVVVGQGRTGSELSSDFSDFLLNDQFDSIGQDLGLF